jgi:excisionase family DNA binding protein
MISRGGAIKMENQGDDARSSLMLSEVAEYLKVCRITVYKMVKKREIPYFRVGRDWRFNRGALDKSARATGKGRAERGAKTPDPAPE